MGSKPFHKPPVPHKKENQQKTGGKKKRQSCGLIVCQGQAFTFQRKTLEQGNFKGLIGEALLSDQIKTPYRAPQKRKKMAA